MTQSRGQNENTDPSFPEELRERYDEVRFVGKGGMGSVYFARDIRLNRHVAIKLLTHTSDNTSSVVRFHQEARAVSKLNNPHVVQVLDFGSTDDCDFFLVMEYIAGQDLEASIAKKGAIPVKEAIDIAMQVCTGLEHAHSHGIVHRDLKPGNIMIDENNRVRVLDFGVAKIVNQADTDHRVTRTGQAVGSVVYMSPEQLRGEETDARSDIYSAGLLIYKMVAGKLPHEDENIMKIIRLRLEGAPPALPPQMGNAEIITKLDTVLSIALANKVADRFDSMTALKSALQDCLSSPAAQHHGDPRAKNTLKIIALVAIVCVSVFALIASHTALSPSTKKHKKIVVKEPKPPAPVKKFPVEQTRGGIWMPPGFSEEIEEDDDVYWTAHDYLTNEDLKPLLEFAVPSLSLQNNHNITKEGISIISPLKLTALCLRDTNIGDDSIDLLNKMDLRNLNLRHTKITEKGILRLKPSSKLLSLDVKYLPITPKGLEAIVHKFPNLVTLNIGETHVNNGNWHVLKRLHKLKNLYLEGAGLDDKSFEELARVDKIVKYELSSNPITDVTIDNLIKKPALEWVSFGACEHVTMSAIKRLQKRFPNSRFEKPAADAPPDELNSMFLKESE